MKHKAFDRVKLKFYIQNCLNQFKIVNDIPIVLQISKRFKNHLASASCRDGIGYITVSHKRFKKLSSLMQKKIIYHEVCHVVDWYLADCFPGIWKSNKMHGKTWRKLMIQIGLKPTVCYNTKKRKKKTI